MTPAHEAEIRKRLEAATPGPWEARSPNIWTVRQDARNQSSRWYAGIAVTAADRSEAQPNADAEFIAAAREDIPILLAEVEKLRSRRGVDEGWLAAARMRRKVDPSTSWMIQATLDRGKLIDAYDHACDAIHDLLSEDALAVALEAGAAEERMRMLAHLEWCQSVWDAAHGGPAATAYLTKFPPIVDPLPPALARLESERLRAALRQVLGRLSGPGDPIKVRRDAINIISEALGRDTL